MLRKFYEKFLEIKSSEIDPKSLAAMKQTVLWLECFERDYKTLTFADIDRQFYDYWYNSFIGEYKESTIGKHIKHIKQFMRWAYKKNLHRNEWALNMRVLKGNCDEEALNSKELLRIYQSDFEMGQIMQLIEHEENAKYTIIGAQKRYAEFRRSVDFFCALCSSGMYPENLKAFDSDMIKNGMVVYQRNKRTAGTYNLCRFPFRDHGVFRFKTLSERYNYNFGSRYRIYQDIRVMLRYLGITKKINTRCGRRTCASIGYFEMGWTQAMTMAVLGHTKWETTRTYLRIDEQVLSEQFQKTPGGHNWEFVDFIEG